MTEGAPSTVAGAADPTKKTFTVALDTLPTANVTIPLEVLDASGVVDATQVTLSASQLVFTPQDGTQPHTVTISAINNEIQTTAFCGLLKQSYRHELGQMEDGSQRYVLKLALTEKIIDVSVLSASNLHRKRLNVSAQYELVETSSGAIANSGSSFSNVSYDVVKQPVADLQAAENAEERAAQELAQDIRQRVAAYFSTKH